MPPSLAVLHEYMKKPYGEVSSLLFVVPIPGGWEIKYRLIPDDQGRLVVAELHVTPTDQEAPVPHDGITAGLLKDHLTISSHIYELLPARLRNERDDMGDRLENDEAFKQFCKFFNPDAKPRGDRRGRKPWPDEEYAELAAEYVQLCRKGQRAPARLLAEKRGMTPGALRAALRRARARALLTPTTAGHAGGELTEHGRRVLRKSRRRRKTRGDKKR